MYIIKGKTKVSICELKRRARGKEYILPTHAPEMFAIVESGILSAGAVFAKIMEVSGYADAISHMIAEKLGKEKAILSVVLCCANCNRGGKAFLRGENASAVRGFSEKELADLVHIREGMGILTGGMPKAY